MAQTKITKEEREQRKIEILKIFAENKYTRIQEVAAKFGVHPITVYRIRKKLADHKNWQSLKRRGRPKTLYRDDRKRLSSYLKKSPHSCRIAEIKKATWRNNFWTIPLLQILIEKVLGVKFSKTHTFYLYKEYFEGKIPEDFRIQKRRKTSTAHLTINKMENGDKWSNF